MNFRQVRQNLAEKQNNNGVSNDVYVDRTLAKLIGVDPLKVERALRRLQRNPNPNNLPPSVRDHYDRYVDASLEAAAEAAHKNKNLFREEINEQRDRDLPTTLIIKRTAIRVFPDGQKVALYVNDRLGLKFTVPYSEDGSNIMAQMNEGKASVGNGLKYISLTPEQLGHITTLHGALNNKNRKALMRHITDPAKLKRLLSFARRHAKRPENR